jgi:2'-5' RNA ligase
LVGPFRERFDPSSKLGVPAHITVLYPFVQPNQITELVIAQMRRFASEHSAFAYSLNSTGQFPDALYLAPNPVQPFVDLIKGLVQYFPAYVPYHGQFDSIVPHLTVAHRESLPLRELEAELSSQGLLKTGIAAYCDMLVLIENTSGLWRERDRFALAAGVR